MAEECGALVDVGLMDRDAAIALIHEAADGGLTKLGAADTLRHWRTLRCDVSAAIVRAMRGIAAAHAQLTNADDSPPHPVIERPGLTGPAIREDAPCFCACPQWCPVHGWRSPGSWPGG